MKTALLALCGLSILFAETVVYDFEREGIEEWEPLGSGAWKVVEESLMLERSGKPPSQPVRRPANLLLVPGPERGAFVLEVDVKSLNPDEKGADVCLFLGVKDERNYVYVHLSNDSDNRTHQVIMKVEGDKGIRTPIQRETDPKPSLTGDWRKVRVERRQDGLVRVFVEDMETPVMTAETPPELSGRIGIGSFNDPAMFDNLRITALE